MFTITPLDAEYAEHVNYYYFVLKETATGRDFRHTYIYPDDLYEDITVTDDGKYQIVVSGYNLMIPGQYCATVYAVSNQVIACTSAHITRYCFPYFLICRLRII